LWPMRVKEGIAWEVTGPGGCSINRGGSWWSASSAAVSNFAVSVYRPG